MNRLTESLVKLICKTLTDLEVCNAEQNFLIPWLKTREDDPRKANLDLAAKIFKLPTDLRFAVDAALAAAGNLADQTLVGHAA